MMNIHDPIAALLGPWASELCTLSILLRVALSVLFSALVGCERAVKRHAAGLRTFIVVSLAGTMAMTLDIGFGASFPVISAFSAVAAAVIAVNCVMYNSKSRIRGLTTSAALWTCNIIGLLLGIGLYTAAFLGFIALVASLYYFPPFERYLKDRSNHFEIHLELKSKGNLQDFVTTIRRLGLKIDVIEANPAYVSSGLSVYSVALTISSPELKKYKTHHEIIEALRSLDYIHYIDEM